MAFLDECRERFGLWSCEGRRGEQAREKAAEKMHGDVWKYVFAPGERWERVGELGSEADEGIGMRIRCSVYISSEERGERTTAEVDGRREKRK